MVPLAEASDSGASTWSAEEREAYANDLGDDRALIAVSVASNRSKADQDPTTWLPPAEGYRCEYVTDWVAHKMRWGLSIDPSEESVLPENLSCCPNAPLTVTLAPVAAGHGEAAGVARKCRARLRNRGRAGYQGQLPWRRPSHSGTARVDALFLVRPAPAGGLLPSSSTSAQRNGERRVVARPGRPYWRRSAPCAHRRKPPSTAGCCLAPCPPLERRAELSVYKGGPVR
ncbi:MULTISPECIES: HNH endonuclease family protein [unclassified Streptomyces]|uniref:HNH endonuclease family protein n=1 Tax=unclassified Streptomyces TaxID=2593676 RepID=UPI0036FEDBC5